MLICGHCDTEMVATDRYRLHDTGELEEDDLDVALAAVYGSVPVTRKVKETLWRCPNCLAQAWLRPDE